MTQQLSDIAERWQQAQPVIAELVSTTAAAQQKGVTRWQIKNWIKQGKVYGARVGRAYLVYAPSLGNVKRSPKGRPQSSGAGRKTRRKTRAQTP